MPVEPSAAWARSDYWPSGRIQAAEGQKVLLRQFARNVDKALRPLLTGSGIPLVLAAAEPLASIYRSVNTYTHLVEATIEGSPEAMTEAELGERARASWMEFTAKSLRPGEAFSRLAPTRAGRPRTLLRRPGPRPSAQSTRCWWTSRSHSRPDRRGRRHRFAEQANASNYDLVDEIATRVITTGGRSLAFGRPIFPGSGACRHSAVPCLIPKDFASSPTSKLVPISNRILKKLTSRLISPGGAKWPIRT